MFVWSAPCSLCMLLYVRAVPQRHHQPVILTLHVMHGVLVWCCEHSVLTGLCHAVSADASASHWSGQGGSSLTMDVPSWHCWSCTELACSGGG